MVRRLPVIALLGVLAFTAACTNKKVSNPLANVGSKQPDKVLFDRAMNDLKHNRFDVARLTLQTLINTYPDSEFIARAKLGVADSWYSEGGTAALQQAEIEYKDFETFFPNMPEAAEAQLKIANIHYQQMEKPDRDYTHALRAEEEYRNLILQYPDSKLVPQAKQRLMQVQEVLAEREFRVGRFYYLRSAYPAAIARLKSLSDEYPLYSKADESLYLLGQAYEGEIGVIRANAKLPEAAKARAIKELTDGATEAYSKILTRYPVMDRADDAKQRLVSLRRPVPHPTREAIARNKSEEDSRRERGMVSKVMGNFSKHPDVSQASKVGEPTLVDPQLLSASEVVRQTTTAMAGTTGKIGNNTVSVETVGAGGVPASEPAPRSDTPASDSAGAATDSTATGDAGNSATAGADPAGSGTTTADPNELKPNVQPDANELKPNVTDGGATAPLPPPQQVNEIQNGSSAPAAANNGQAADSASSSADQKTSDQADQPVASSKHKKKKGLKKVIPF